MRFSILFIAVLGLFLSSSALQANITYSYTGGNPISMTFVTDLSLAALENIPSNTNITSSIVSNTYHDLTADLGGFGIGVNDLQAISVAIGTNALGNITSWSITGTYFASFPSTPGGDPNAFFCTYAPASTNSGGTLVTDHDAGLCPTTTGSQTVAGTWSSNASITPAPEPESSMLICAGLLGVWALAKLRRSGQLS
jgi:hypothetical protein